MDEKQEYCSNCKKYVGAANFASHNAFCQRNLVICEVCDEPVPRKQIAEHEKEYHIYVKCEKCNASVKKYKISKHQEICPKRLVPCDYCEGEFFFDVAEEHVEFCGSRSEMCELCGNYIVLKNKQKHLQLHQSEKDYHRGHGAGEIQQNIRNEYISQTYKKNQKKGDVSPLKTENFDSFNTDEACAAFSKTLDQYVEDCKVLCPFCNQQFQPEEMHEHIKSCKNNNFKCGLCCETVLEKDRNEHLTYQCKMLQERNPSDLYECPLCEEKILEKDKSLHESFYCKALFENADAVYSLHEEKNSNNRASKSEKNSTETFIKDNKNARKKCTYCFKELRANSSEALHLRLCDVYKQLIAIKRKSSEKGAKPKHSNFSEIAKPKVGKCTYCKTTLNDDILLFHEQECVYRPIKCQGCSATVRLIDIEDHHCKSIKGSSKGKGGARKNPNEKSESWFSSLIDGFRSNLKTHDELQDQRNEPYARNFEKKYYHGQENENPFFPHEFEIDEPKIPCEFCNKIFPASEIVVHTTGCNPAEVSLPKADSRENFSNNKHSLNSSTSLQSFFPTDRKTYASSIEYKNAERNLKQPSGIRPGELLSSYTFEVSSDVNNDSQNIKGKNQSSSTLKSVWNGDSSDVEMEELDPETNLKTSSTASKDVHQKSKEPAYKTSKYSFDSDDEMSTMVEYIKGKTVESNSVKKNISLSNKRYEQSKVHSSEEPAPIANRDQGVEQMKNEYRFYNSEENSTIDKIEKKAFKNPNLCERKKDTNEEMNPFNKIGSLQYEHQIHGLDTEYPTAKTNRDHAIEATNEYHFHNSEENSVIEEIKKESLMNPNLTERKTDSIDNEGLNQLNKFGTLRCEQQIHSIDTEYPAAKSNREYGEEKTKNEYHLSNYEENCVTDEIIKEIHISPSLCERKKDSDSDGELNRLNKIDTFHCKQNVYGIETDYSQSDILNDKKKKQISHDVTKVKSTLDESKKLELSDLRLHNCSKRDSFDVARTLCDSKMEESDVYYKTNALGFVIVSEDENSQIRRPRKKDIDNALQKRILKSKYEDLESVVLANQKENNEDRVQTASSFFQKSNEMLRSKYEDAENAIETNREENTKIRAETASLSQNSNEVLKYECLDENTVRRSFNKADHSRTLDNSCIPEKAIEVIRSKYEYQNDKSSEQTKTRSEENAESRTDYLSPSAYEIEILRSKYKYMPDDSNQKNQNYEVEIETGVVSSTSSGTTKRISTLKQKHQYNDDDTQANQYEKHSSKIQSDSPMSEISNEVPTSKHKYKHTDDIQPSQPGEYTTKFLDASPFVSQTSKEILRSKYMCQTDDIPEAIQNEILRIKTQDISSSISENPFKISRSKHEYQYNDIKEESQKQETEDKIQDISPAMSETLKEGQIKGANEPSKFWTTCPICKKYIKWIDYNIHLPACATFSGRCALCKEEVPESDMKEHTLVKCPQKARQVQSVRENIENISTSRINSYEQIFQSIAPNELDFRKLKHEERNEGNKYENYRSKTSVYEDYSESVRDNNTSRIKQAFKIEPAESNQHTSRFTHRKSINNSENTREKYLKEISEHPISPDYNDEDIEKWCKWRSKPSDDN